MNLRHVSVLFLSLIFLLISAKSISQKSSNESLRSLVERFKSDVRGPYQDIRWFCKDGSTLSPQERCPEPGVQRARYKKEVLALAKSDHIYLGQILSTTNHNDFWDEDHQQSRLKQYQLELFLRANDEGWVNQKAQYYRGAFQTEDEEAWGIAFYSWLLKDPSRIAEYYFLIRQSAKDIPHAGDSNLAQSVRAISREISDVYAPFMNLRVKIHGQPEQSDIAKVREFQSSHASKMTISVQQKMDKLLVDMERLYLPVEAKDFQSILSKLPSSSIGGITIQDFLNTYSPDATAQENSTCIAETAVILRKEIQADYKPSAKLALIDISNKLEAMLLREESGWKPATVKEQLEKVYTLSEAAAGFGYLEEWEWRNLARLLKVPEAEEFTLTDFNDHVENARRGLEWGTGMVRGNYYELIELYGGFEPLAHGFIDDRVRASVLLPLGNAVSVLGDAFARKAGFSNQMMSIPDQSAGRGLNPGYAMGELVVTDLSPESIEVDAAKIYVFDRPPADLKPVAGIATVTEGNMVSHVQLLARNLGIPNAVLSKGNLLALMPYNGQQVFYAVSNKGTVILKPAAEMTAEEKALFSKKVRSEDKISVPIDEMQLDNPEILNLRAVNASNSGISCGPKAANLGQLKQLYPEHVVEGLVIPFSIFKAHFEQEMPKQNKSYWQFLKDVFAQGDAMLAKDASEQEVETFTLEQLAVLRAAIKEIVLIPSFKDELARQFIGTFGQKMGSVPVFLRSDTNMEDLKDFTGAGLNLTLFNVLDQDAIWQGIKDVWASPYTERSYRWRQRYLLDPANVFPSILIIPSVDVDYSGVMITKGVSSGKDNDVTVAFNKGVGGAVEGQASESWLLEESGYNLLVSPAREPEYMSIPSTGGMVKKATAFEDRLLSIDRLMALRTMAGRVQQDLSALGIKGPYDMELGFKDDKIWLFQVRPFVENKRAFASDYLRSITPEIDEKKLISLNSKL